MTTTQQLADETALNDLFDRMNRAWKEGDAKAYAAAFTPDADYVTWFGSHLRGREAIEASHVRLFTKYLKNTHLDGGITGVRFVTPDVALVHAEGAVVKGKRRRNSFNTKVNVFVAVRRDGEWAFTAFHNTKHSWLFNTLFAEHDPGIRMSQQA